VETDAAALQLETSAIALELETDAAALELETSMTALELETSMTALELDMDVTALELETYASILDLETDKHASWNIEAEEVFDWLGVIDNEVATDGSISIEVYLHWTLLVTASHIVSIVSSGGTSSFRSLNSHAPCPPWSHHRMMCRSRHCQAWYDVDTLALFRPSFESFLRLIK
jgi:hypothetical protein